MNILFLSRWFPYPPDNGSKIRIYNLIRQLSKRHRVDLISFTAGHVTAEQSRVLAQSCRKVEAVSYRPFQPGRLQALAGFFSMQPRSWIDTHSVELERLAVEAAAREHYDIVIASQVDMVPYALALAKKIPIRIFEEIELTTLYEQATGQQSALRRLRSSLTWGKLSFYLPRVLRMFQGCTVVSEIERQRVLEIAGNACPVDVVPNGVDLAALRGDFGKPEPDTLIYNGSVTYSANYDAVKYFLDDIFPRIEAQRPGVRLLVTGNVGDTRLDQMYARENVIFSGYLEDVRPAVASAWVSVVPLRQGGGTRLKILESLALGTPVVATRKGAEGIDLRAGENFLQADEPGEFAKAVLGLLGDAGSRQRLSEAGRQAVEKYDWALIGENFNCYVDKVANDGRF